ncbi:MAG: response regulator [Opitutae bacterium]|nr:response regulator [Opitutae bacterium]
MEKINIICVDDQAEVLDSVIRDLRPLSKYFRIEECESAADATNVMSEIVAGGDFVGLVISDHVMPGKNGVDLLGEIAKNPSLRGTKKILLTGQATHSDTIRAINDAGINSYLEKPWKPEELLGKAKELLTSFIFEKGISYEEYMPVLDQKILIEKLHRG